MSILNWKVSPTDAAKVRVGIDAGLKVDTGLGWTLPMGADTTGRS